MLTATIISTLAKQAGADGLEQFDGFATKITNWAELNKRYLDDADKEPTPKEIEAELKSLEMASRNLETAIETSSLDASMTLSGVIGELVSSDPTPERAKYAKFIDGGARLYEVREHLRFLAQVAKIGASEWSKQKRGPQRKSRRVAIRRDAVFELGGRASGECHGED